jgi:S-adenosylmethionine hydrolase
MQFIDISHNIAPFNISQAAFVLKSAYTKFPSNTIHVISVHNDRPSEYIVLLHKGQYFIGPNNGLFALLFDDLELLEKSAFTIKDQKINKLAIQDLIANAVNDIVLKKPLIEIGPLVKQITQRFVLQPIFTQNCVRGIVMYIDHYENVIVNITKSFFDRASKGRAFEIYFKRNNPITSITTGYNKVPIGDVLCFFNDNEHLEIAINMGKAASLLNLKLDDAIQIDFIDKP